MAQTGFKPVTWVFYGRVLPDMPAISIPLPMHTSTTTLGISFELDGQIHNSKIMATVRQLDEANVLTLKNLVADDIQGSVDLTGFLAGAGLDVDLISARADDGAWQYFDAFIPALRVEGNIEVPAGLIIASGNDIQAHIMLADFREAIRVPVQTGFFCYRAVEAAMQSFKSAPNEDDKKTWPVMRSELCIQMGALLRIKAHADWARHGQSGSISDADRLAVLTTTRSIIQRYLDYVVGGRTKLDASRYPQIS